MFDDECVVVSLGTTEQSTVFKLRDDDTSATCVVQCWKEVGLRLL